MSKQIILVLFLLIFFTTACNPETPITSTKVIEVVTPTLESTPRPPSTSIPKPTLESIVAPTPTFTRDRIYIMGWKDDTIKFENDDMVNTTIQCADLQKMNITLKSNVDISILVSIIPGTLFETFSSSVQTMVARELREIILEPFVEISLELDVACAEMHLDTPGPGDSFTAVWPPTIPALSKLVSSESFIEEDSFRVQQFAIWAITDNPSRGNFVGLASIGTGSGPSDDELRQIHQLFIEAGIPMDEYQALD